MENDCEKGFMDRIGELIVYYASVEWLGQCARGGDGVETSARTQMEAR